MKLRGKFGLFIFLAIVLFIAWRFVRPMNIFIVSDAFENIISTSNTPEILTTLSATGCAQCHQEFYDEWSTSIHSQAWTDPYFQVDWQFDGSPHICRNCHTPLDKQQPELVTAYNDSDKWDPVLKKNPHFDKSLQHEGVTCNACHLRDGKIMGVFGDTDAPHPVKKLDNPNQVCVRCHVVEGERWDTFFRFPPCGTVAEIQSSLPDTEGKNKTGELSVEDISSLNCVECHMPAVERAMVEGGKIRVVRQHLWRGGHDPEMVKQALTVTFTEGPAVDSLSRLFVLTLENTGAAHYVPTGTPDRHLTVEINLLDAAGDVLKQQTETLIRTVLWRPFIIDLWDTRLKRYEPREYQFMYDADDYPQAEAVEVIVRYHLLEESRRKRIAYENEEPIKYEVFRSRILID